MAAAKLLNWLPSCIASVEVAVLGLMYYITLP